MLNLQFRSTIKLDIFYIMFEFAASLVPALFLFLYLVCISVEVGVAVLYVFPKLLPGLKRVKPLVTPLWETTNLFLVGAIVGVLTLFPGTFRVLSESLMTVLLIAIFFIALRVLGVFLMSYAGIVNSISKYLFLVGSVMSPLILINGFVFFLTGQKSDLFFSPISMFFYLLGLMTIIFLSTSFFSYFEHRPGKELLRIRDFSSIFFVGLALMSFIMFSDRATYLVLGIIPQIFLISLEIIIMLIFMIFQSYKNHQGSAFFLSVFLVSLYYFSLLMMHLPYVIYSDFTIYNSFVDPAASSVLTVIGLLAGMASTCGLIFMNYLHITKPHK